MKRSVLTITANPALDLSGEVSEVVPNEKNYVHAEARHPGGNAINVSRVLTRLRVPNLATGFLGGATGLEVQNLLKLQGVKTRFITISGSTRVNITVQNKKDHDQTRLSFPGPLIKKKEKQRILDLLTQSNASRWVVGGSLPEGVSEADLKTWISLANRKGIPIVLDVPGKVLKHLKRQPISFIKPNFSEWSIAVGWNQDVPDLQTLVRISRLRFPETEWICISSFQGGAVLVGRTEVYFGKLPRIQVRSTVGAGDSMVAGWVAGQHSGMSPIDSLRRALACAGATLGTRGTELAHLKEVLRLETKCIVSKVEIPIPAKIRKN